ncbi:MAG: glycosyltransferase [Candidatus Dadabacteria bacterium]|nr:glycosyltransferase [Candidatus Dadabacteria bacterium]
MLELTVSMPAYNTGEYIREAIQSVLRQEGIDFELIVVDDGSQDNTSEVVQSFKDPRIRLIINKKNMGIAYCHNLVIEQSRSPFIAHVDSDDLVLPDAFQKVVNELKSNSDIGQVHCYYFMVDEDGRATRDAFRGRRKHFLETRKPDMDYKRELILQGRVMNGLRTYRKEVFDTVGKFDENIRWGEDYEMALRIIDKFEIKLVPEFLYCVRKHKSNATPSSQSRKLVWWRKKLFICRKLSKSNEVQWLAQNKYHVTRLMILDLCDALGLEKISKRIVKLPKKVRNFIIRRVLTPIFDQIYALIDDNFSWWPISLFNYKKRDKPIKAKRIAYYIWHFPVPSQTFIQREIAALRKSSVSVEVVSDAPEDIELLNENAKSLINSTFYLFPIDEKLLLRYKRYFFLKNPLLYFNLFLYVVFHKYDKHKSFKEDISILSRAVYLAGVLKDKNINHIHSPWADRCAFIALIASKLLGASYSLQGRAHDIHRKTYLYAFPEKFENAEFVITNTQYNEVYLRSSLNSPNGRKIYTIYNGLNIVQFTPNHKQENKSKQTRILSVARLIEQKGLVYLLKACKILKERGYTFRCEIIGGPEEPLYINYYLALKKLHRQMGLEECVFFLGAKSIDKVLEEYRNAHIFVLPCVIAEDGSRDISPNALIEAMAMKLPVISTNVTGIPEIVEDGVSGILVPPHDENALAGAIVKLIENDNLRKELGENARKKVEERFDIDKNIVKYVALFEGHVY